MGTTERLLKYDLWSPGKDAQTVLKKRWHLGFSWNTGNNTLSAGDSRGQAAGSRQDETKHNGWGMEGDGAPSRKQLHHHLQPAPLWLYFQMCVPHVPPAPTPQHIHCRSKWGTPWGQFAYVRGAAPKKGFL